MTESLFPVAPKLTDRQAVIYGAATAGPLTALHAGLILHTDKGCLYCKPDQPCQYAEQAGREVLEALRKKGLLARDRHHVYARTDAPAVVADGAPAPVTDPFPEGF